MSQSQNNPKVLLGWSAVSARHIYPVNRKDNYHQKLWNRRGGKLYKMKLIIGETLMTLTLHSQS